MKIHKAFKEIVAIRLKQLGKAPICNLQKHRAPQFYGLCFPLCWRCSSIIMGALLSKHFLVSRFSIDFTIAVFLILPTALDGFLQYHCKKESTNSKRILTGLLAGCGIFTVLGQI